MFATKSMEVDAYCLSTIAGYARKVVNEDITVAPLAALNRAFVYFNNMEVSADDQVAFCSPEFLNALRNTNEVTKFLGQTDFERNKDIKFEITRYQGRDLIMVAPSRLRTNIVLDKGGYHWDPATSEAINFLMVAKSAVTHVVKYEKVKVISGDVNLAARGFDGYTVFVRIYHDVFVPDNKRVAIYLSCPQTAVPAPQVQIEIKLDGNNRVKKIDTLPGDMLVFVGSTTDVGTITVGSTILTNFTKLNVGDTIASTTTFYAINSDKRVLGLVTVTIA